MFPKKLKWNPVFYLKVKYLCLDNYITSKFVCLAQYSSKKKLTCLIFLPNYFWMTVRSGKVTCKVPIWDTAKSFIGYQFLVVRSLPYWASEGVVAFIHTYTYIYVYMCTFIIESACENIHCLSEFWSPHLRLCFPAPSTLLKVSQFSILCSWIIFYGAYVPHLHYPFVCWWTVKLLLFPWCCG